MAVTAEDLRAQQDAVHADGGSMRGLLRSGQRLLHSYALLAVLDVRRATVQLTWLIASGVLIAVLVVTAWLGLITALVTWLAGQDFSWPVILLIAAGLNLLFAGVLGWRMKDLVTEMPFAATLRQLKGDTPLPPDASS